MNVNGQLHVSYTTHYDAEYWQHRKQYRDAQGNQKTYFGPSLQWEGFEFIAEAMSRVLHKGTLLDVGCGGGDLSARLMKRGYDCFGIEVSQYAIDNCVPEMKGRICLADVTDRNKMDAFVMNTKGVQYDNVIATDFLEHLYEEDLDRTFNFLMSRVKPGGFMFFLVAITQGEEFIAKKGEPIPEKWTETAISGHVNVRKPSFWKNFFKSRAIIEWERMYLFQSLREQVPAWKGTAGWDHPFTWIIRP